MSRGVSDVIEARRSIKQFTDREVSRAEIEQLIGAAVHAPNHRMTQPVRFHVLGPRARHAYGLALGERKAKRVEDAHAARMVRDKVAADHETLPAMIAVSILEHENPEIREEDYATAMMAVQNMALAAVELGLGTHIKTGGVMDDPAARAAVGVPDGQRIVACVNVGEPADVPAPKDRLPAADVTSWLA